MRMLHVAAKFINNHQDLVFLYKTFIRSVLEFSAVVWNSSLSQNNINDIERIQKAAVKVILKEKYKDYSSALSELNLETLSKRREMLCLRFAKKCLKLNKFKNMFPLNEKYHVMKQRKARKFKQNQSHTERYLKSSIPYMQSLLNKDHEMQNSLLKCNAKGYYDSELYLHGSITDDYLNYNK